MPRLNVNISDEAKAIFSAYKTEKGLDQDAAANALLLEFQKLRALSPIIGYALEDSKPCPDGKHHYVKVSF